MESAAASEEGVVVYADRPVVEVAWVVLEEGAATVAEVEVAMEEAVVVMAPENRLFWSKVGRLVCPIGS